MSAAPKAASLRQLFVVPDLRGRPTGGTVYNANLVAGLTALGARVSVTTLDELADALSAARADMVWLDSLYLDHAREAKARVGRGVRFGLLLHYLPALVANGKTLDYSMLSASERSALELADCALVSGEFMREALARWRPSLPTLCVVPGSNSARCETLPGASEGLRALLVAHLVPGKGVEPLLVALADELGPADDLRLLILGDDAADALYARRCRELVAGAPKLRPRVSFGGLVTQEGVLGASRASNLLVSASRMESYGMALADGRRVGLPLLACDGGNVRQHVTATAGGELASDVPTLARAVVRLARDPAEHARRLAAAAASALPPRPWREAAAELLAALQAETGS
jgi:glycosyltransferase involved in cell wall biosynthesis